MARAAPTLALVVTACGGETGTVDQVGETTPAPTGTTAPEEEPPPEATETTPEDGEAAARATAAVTSSDPGEILVDGGERALRVYPRCVRVSQICTGDCAGTWPPLEGPGNTGEGVDADLLGTVEHPDGAIQVSYNGQGVGDNWYVVGADGQPVRDMEAGGAGY